MTAPRVAIVGAGLMGRWHAHAVRRAGSAVIAVIDPDRPRALQLASRCRAPVVTATLGEALRHETIDLVHVCAPLAAHAALAHEAIEGGCHVLVEKPFADSLAETRRILDRAAAQSRFAVPVHQFPWQRSARRARALLPTIAPIRHLAFTACSAGAIGQSGEAADRIAAEIVPHPLSLVAALLPGALEGVTWHVQRSAAGEWQVAAHHDGTAIDIMISMAGRPPVNQLRVIGEGGTLHLDLFHDFVIHESAGHSRAGKVFRPLVMAVTGGGVAAGNLVHRAVRGEPAYPGLGALVRATHLAVRDNGPPPIAPSEVLEIAKSWETIRAMAGPGR